MTGLLTLTTDYGTQDQYVGALKGVVIQTAPEVRMVDISHGIPPGDILAGAWVVREASRYYPGGTVHLVVVDPGVGSERTPVIVHTKDQWFVGPDNGLFSLISEGSPVEAFTIDRPEHWLANPSSTFHGRDIFAPVAALLASGTPPDTLGSAGHELVTYRWAEAILDRDGIRGWVVHVDHYGNLISNVPASYLNGIASAESLKIYVGNTIIARVHNAFSDVEEGDPVAYIGSSGTLEVAVNRGNAQELLGISKGAQITIVFQR